MHSFTLYFSIQSIVSLINHSPEAPFIVSNQNLHKQAPRKKLGILLVNLGSPDAATPSAVRSYLAEFLSDPRVIEANRFIWWFALHGVILRIRPPKAAKSYQKVWTEDGSPLTHISKLQTKAIQEELDTRFQGQIVTQLAMTYGNPSIKSGLEKLREAGAQQLLVLPLYPQYSATTTAAGKKIANRKLSAGGNIFFKRTEFISYCPIAHSYKRDHGATPSITF